jgi:uncharacterized protein (DUF983 family)
MILVVDSKTATSFQELKFNHHLSSQLNLNLPQLNKLMLLKALLLQCLFNMAKIKAYSDKKQWKMKMKKGNSNSKSKRPVD